MTPDLPEDPAELRGAMSRLLNAAVQDAERVPSFAGNRVYRLTTDGGHLFVKIGAENAIATEHAVLQLVADHQVPAPVVHAADLDGSVTGYPCLVTRELEGAPLTGSSRPSAASPVTCLGSTPSALTGFGAIGAPATGGLHGEDPAWLAALARRVESCREVVEAGLVPGVLVDATANALMVHPGIAAFEDGRLLHGDFHPRHVYSDGVHVTGIIDWGDATSGDPDYDIARVLHSVLLRDDLSPRRSGSRPRPFRRDELASTTNGSPRS